MTVSRVRIALILAFMLSVAPIGALPARAAPPAISNIQATATATGATIEWRTNEPADSVVEYGTTTAYGQSASDPRLVTTHLITISGLTADTVYHYRVKSKNGAGEETVSGDIMFLARDVDPCPCGLWDDSARPEVEADPETKSTELGVRFRSAIDGYVTGIRFYKGPGNGGSHVGSLWYGEGPSMGTRIASATFTGETATGWQRVKFGAPIPIEAGKTYVASYYAPVGRYATTREYFRSKTHTRWPLTAPVDNALGGQPNGAYLFGPNNFPTQSYNESNYWVDVIFATEPDDRTPPTIADVRASNVKHNEATVGWTTSEPSDSQVEFGLTSGFGSTTTLDRSQVAGHTVTLTGLIPSKQYYYRVKSRDAEGNLATSDTFSFVTERDPDQTPPAISGAQATNVGLTAASIVWSTNEASDSQVEYGPNGTFGSSTTRDATMVTQHSQQLANLQQGTTYSYRVKSRDAAGNLATSAALTFKTTAPTPPPAPPTPTACSPRPNAQVSVAPAGPGRLQVTVTAGTSSLLPNNSLELVRFGAATNALIDAGGQSNKAGSFDVALPAGTRSTTFTVRRATAGVATTVPVVVVDRCGEWPTMVGGGPSAF